MDRQRLLRLRTQAHEPDGLLITVEDTGGGIDPQHADRIFEPFFTTKPQGMGMGLSICRSIVEHHGGHLSVAPGLTHGSIFQVALPAAPLGAAAAAAVTPLSEGAACCGSAKRAPEISPDEVLRNST